MSVHMVVAAVAHHIHHCSHRSIQRPTRPKLCEAPVATLQPQKLNLLPTTTAPHPTRTHAIFDSAKAACGGVCMYVCMYVRTYVRMYACMCVYIHVYIYILHNIHTSLY